MRSLFSPSVLGSLARADWPDAMHLEGAGDWLVASTDRLVKPAQLPRMLDAAEQVATLLGGQAGMVATR